MSAPNEHGASLPPPAPLELLETDELLALGLRASAAGDAASALSFFKGALARHPRHAQAHWMLGAEYAALQLSDRAHEHLARAVELDPAQPVARFQLGLLRLTRGDVEGAQQTWQANVGIFHERLGPGRHTCDSKEHATGLKVTPRTEAREIAP